jgi:hypothetical protein
MAQAPFVHIFIKPGAPVAMDFDSTSDDLLCELFFLQGHSSVLSLLKA